MKMTKKSQKSQNVQKGLKNEVGRVEEAKSPYVEQNPISYQLTLFLVPKRPFGLFYTF